MKERRNTGWALRASWASGLGLGLGMTGLLGVLRDSFMDGFGRGFLFFLSSVARSSDWFVGDGRLCLVLGYQLDT
jgi:hypothetical protein